MVGIVEVSPRDGLQNERALLETGAKVELIERAVAAGVRRIEAVSFVHPRLVPAQRGQAGARDVLAAHDRGRRVHEEHRAGRPVGQQRRQRLHVARDRRVADAVDRIGVRPRGRQQAVELRDTVDLQDVELDLDDVQRLELRVVSVFGGQVGSAASVTEVTAFTVR